MRFSFFLEKTSALDLVSRTLRLLSLWLNWWSYDEFDKTSRILMQAEKITE